MLRYFDGVITREQTNVFNFDIQRILASKITRNGLLVSIAGIILFVAEDQFDSVTSSIKSQIRQTINSRCFLKRDQIFTRKIELNISARKLYIFLWSRLERNFWITKVIPSRLTTATNADKIFVSKLKLRVAKQRDARKELTEIIYSEVHRKNFLASKLCENVLCVRNSSNRGSFTEDNRGIDGGKILEDIKGFFRKDNFTHGR